MKIAVIPARDGSKRIPRKNIKKFLGRSIISYPIAVLQETRLFDRILVSTEDQEIAEIAAKAGAEIPFVRPAGLADDHTGTADVIRHATEWLIEHGERPEYVCCVYATTPFLNAAYVKSGWEAVRVGMLVALSVTRFSLSRSTGGQIIGKQWPRTPFSRVCCF